MNENFNNAMESLGVTAYRLSKDTGIPYTTISELCNNKIDINKCSAETVYKLALYFECEMKDILNYVNILENYSGKYLGHKFRWNKGREPISLSVEINGKVETITPIPKVCTSRPHLFKRAYTELLIDKLLEEKNLEKLL